MSMFGVKRVVSVFTGKGRTKQSFKPICDINTIVARYQSTGALSHLTSKRSSFGDFSNVPNYQVALNTVIFAQSAFESLPSKVRARFANDPAKLLAFVGDKANRDEAISLGLIDKPVLPVPPPPVVPVVPKA